MPVPHGEVLDGKRVHQVIGDLLAVQRPAQTLRLADVGVHRSPSPLVNVGMTGQCRHVMTTIRQRLGDGGTDEPRRPRDRDSHREQPQPGLGQRRLNTMTTVPAGRSGEPPSQHPAPMTRAHLVDNVPSTKLTPEVLSGFSRQAEDTRPRAERADSDPHTPGDARHRRRSLAPPTTQPRLVIARPGCARQYRGAAIRPIPSAPL